MPWAPPYLLADDLKAYLRIPSGDLVDDTLISDAIEAASRAVDEATGRQFGLLAAPEARYYTARWGGPEVVIDDLMTTDGLTVDLDRDGSGAYASTIEAADYRLTDLNAAGQGVAWTALLFTSDLPTGVGAVRVTARWGWSAVPGAIVTATKLQASRLLKRRDSPFGIAGSPEMGNELRLLAKLDPDVEVLVYPYSPRGTYGRYEPRLA